MSLNSRFRFVAGSIGTIKSLLIGSLDVNDNIISENGLKATVKGYMNNYYIITITDGEPFQSKHDNELQFNHSLERYEIYAQHLRKWRLRERDSEYSRDYNPFK